MVVRGVVEERVVEEDRPADVIAQARADICCVARSAWSKPSFPELVRGDLPPGWPCISKLSAIPRPDVSLFRVAPFSQQVLDYIWCSREL